MEILFLFVFIAFVLINKIKSKTILNGFTVVFTPYVFIVLVNNYLCLDFYSIKLEIIAILLFAMVIYELTFLIFYSLNKKNSFSTTKKLTDCYSIINFKIIEWFVVVIIIFRLLSIGIIYARGGLSAISANDYSSLDLGIIGGRFIIFLYPLGWILALKTFDSRIKVRERIVDFFLCLSIIIVLFLSTVKAHAAIFAIGLFVVSCFMNKKNIVRGGIVLILLVFLMFFGNYAIRWFAVDSSIPTLDFTLRHFWKYVAGGTINMNGTALSGTTKYNFFDYWIHVLSPIPNEFLSMVGLKITHSGSFPYLTPMASVSPKYDELSNVINLFGFFYGEGGINIFGFIINTAIFAYVTEWASSNARNPKSLVRFIISICILTYAFLSFFSLYYATSGFWQIMFYSALLSWIFGGGIKELSASKKTTSLFGRQHG